MKIERPTVKAPASAYGAVASRPAVPKNQPEGVRTPDQIDRVNVSVEAQQAHLVRKQLHQAPEVRAELVEQIKARVAAGTYSVSPHDLAERLLKAKVLDL